MNVADAPLAHGLRDPGCAAIRCGVRTVTYGELRTEALAVATGLTVSREVDGRTVAIDLADGPAFYCAFLGAVAAGAIAVPFSPAWTHEERARALAVVAPAAVIADRPSPGPPPALSFADLAQSPLGSLQPGHDSSRPFYIGFSSGSTGVPRAIVRSHHAWLMSFLAMTAEFGIGPGAQVAVPGSPFFSFSLIAGLHALTVGATLHLPSRAGLAGMLPLLAESGVTLYAIPSLVDDLSRALLRRRDTAPGIVRVICAGEKLRAEVRQRAASAFPAAAIIEYYGASELGYVAVAHPADAAARPESVGRPFPGTEVAILDPDGAPCPPGVVGLLCARNEYGFAGYWGVPGGTAAIGFHGWPTAGDLAWRDEDGYLYLAGRRDNMLVLRGENVFPEEVEHVLASAPRVGEAAVLGEPSTVPTHLVALVTAAEGAALDRRAVLDHCRARLAPTKVPRRVVIVPSLPRTATGKLDRAALRALASPGAGDAWPTDPPRP